VSYQLALPLAPELEALCIHDIIHAVAAQGLRVEDLTLKTQHTLKALWISAYERGNVAGYERAWRAVNQALEAQA